MMVWAYKQCVNTSNSWNPEVILFLIVKVEHSDTTSHKNKNRNFEHDKG